MVQNNINGSLNKWANIDWREERASVLGVLSLFINYLITYKMNTDFRVAEVELSYKNRVPYKDRKKVLTSEDAYKLLLNNHDDNTIDYTETFKVLYLNQSSQVVGCNTLSKGGITTTCVDVRNVMQGALLTNAVAMVLGHNHPSGNTRPSREDDRITNQIVKAGQLLNIQVIDHIIFTREQFYSYNDEGRI